MWTRLVCAGFVVFINQRLNAVIGLWNLHVFSSFEIAQPLITRAGHVIYFLAQGGADLPVAGAAAAAAAATGLAVAGAALPLTDLKPYYFS
jgi:hypothetical protein